MTQTLAINETVAAIGAEAYALAENWAATQNGYKHHCAGKEAANRSVRVFTNVWRACTPSAAFALDDAGDPAAILAKMTATIDIMVANYDHRPTVQAAERRIVAQLRRWVKALS